MTIPGIRGGLVTLAAFATLLTMARPGEAQAVDQSGVAAPGRETAASAPRRSWELPALGGEGQRRERTRSVTIVSRAGPPTTALASSTSTFCPKAPAPWSTSCVRPSSGEGVAPPSPPSTRRSSACPGACSGSTRWARTPSGKVPLATLTPRLSRCGGPSRSGARCGAIPQSKAPGRKPAAAQMRRLCRFYWAAIWPVDGTGRPMCPRAATSASRATSAVDDWRELRGEGQQVALGVESRVAAASDHRWPGRRRGHRHRGADRAEPAAPADAAAPCRPGAPRRRYATVAHGASTGRGWFGVLTGSGLECSVQTKGLTRSRQASQCELKQLLEKLLPGSDLLSHAPTHTVPSAVAGLTSVFGMGTGVTLPL